MSDQTVATTQATSAPKPKTTLTVGRKHSILGKTFRIQRTKVISPEDITKPVNVRHTAHVGASGHNFGDLSFLEPGGRCSKTNGLECIVDYDSPVLTKVREISPEGGSSTHVNISQGSSTGDIAWVEGDSKSRELLRPHGGGSNASDSGHGSSTDPDVSDIASEISSRDVKNDLTEDDISDLTSLDQSVNNKRVRRASSCDSEQGVALSTGGVVVDGDYFDFAVDMGPSLLDDVMGTIEKLEVRRSTKSGAEQKAIKI